MKRNKKSLVLALALCFGSLSHAVAGSTPIPSLTEVIYSSTTDIDQKYTQFQDVLREKIDQFINYSQKEQFEKAYSEWTDLCNSFFTLKIMLGWTAGLSPDENLKQYAEAKKAELFQATGEMLKNQKKLANAFIANGLAARALTPEQRYMTHGILNDYLQVQKGDKIEAALKNLSRYKESNYTFVEKKSSQTMPTVIDELRVFTANIICFPEQLTYPHGGISPWKNRIEDLVQRSKETRAHILCFQEVWDTEAMNALVEHLRDQYSFFVYDAGNQFATIDSEEIGYASGLFVASQIPIDGIAFTPFSTVFPAKGGARRGGLLIKCTVGDQKISFVTTHLQHGDDARAISIRKEQFLTCHQILQTAIAESARSSWGFLLGDININAFSQEFADSGMQRLFSIPYLKGQTQVTPTNATATNYFLDLFLAPLEKRKDVAPTYELLDYCICPAALKKHYLNQKIPLFSISSPGGALSDHQGLLTTWKMGTGN